MNAAPASALGNQQHTAPFAGVNERATGQDYCPFAIRLFQRSQASVRAFLSASFASGASPARIKPCPAPSYVTGSNVLPAVFILVIASGIIAPIRASFPAKNP